jgi:hypothetical protein
MYRRWSWSCGSLVSSFYGSGRPDVDRVTSCLSDAFSFSSDRCVLLVGNIEYLTIETACEDCDFCAYAISDCWVKNSDALIYFDIFVSLIVCFFVISIYDTTKYCSKKILKKVSKHVQKRLDVSR